MPDCNLEGQTITINWTATCPDELLRVLLADRDNLLNVQTYTNVPNTGTFDFVVSNNDLIDGNYNFYIDFYPSQVDWIHGPISYQVNDPQISVLEELYDLTDGDVWFNNTGWFSDCDPCGVTSGSPWYGLTCNGMGQIVKIDLSSNGLIGEYGDDESISSSNHLCDLSNLQHIDLSNNQLTGPISSCYFSTAKDTLRLDNNMLSGGIPIEIYNVDQDMVLDISYNNLTGCFENSLNPRCDMVNFSNETISDGNFFESNWEDFCNSGKGVCCESEVDIDLAIVENGTYYAHDQINLSGISNASTDIILAAPLVKISDVLTQNTMGAQIEINPYGCFDKVGMNFTSSSDHLLNNDFALADDFTMTFWFKTSANQTSYEGRIFNLHNPTNRFEIGIENHSNKFWAFDASNTYSSSEAYNDGIWHHVIVRNEGSNIDFYVDGEIVFTSNNGLLSLTGGFHIGRFSFSNIAHYQGSLSDLRIYNDALEVSSVLKEYECGIYENDALLDLHYSFSEGIPNGDNTAISTVIDDSGNNNDASIEAMTLTGSESNYIEAEDIVPLECCAQGFVITCYSVIVEVSPITGDVSVNATIFDDGTELNCGDSYTVSYTEDGLTTEMVFDCSDVGPLMPITIYYLSADGLLIDSCDTFIEVQDNDGVCP